MTSGGGKEAVADAVRGLPAEKQVDLLAQALLREYMHRKGYHRTLSKFDEENPRGETTISSRQLMHSLMALDDTLAPRNKKRAKPLGTIMELLCSYRLRKRAIRLTSSPKAARASDEQSDSSDDEKQLEALAAAKRAEIARVNELIKEREAAEMKRKAQKVKKEKALEKEGKKDKKAKKEKGGDSPAIEPTGSTSSKAKQMNALQSAMTTIAGLPTGSAQRSAFGSGHNWTPGGNAAAVPNVGLSSSSAGASSALVNEKPPCFLAGAGMALMVNRVMADPHQVLEMSGSARLSNSFPTSFSPSRHSADGEEDGPVPSPYRGLGTAPYDPNLKTKGVIRRSPSEDAPSPSSRTPSGQHQQRRSFTPSSTTAATTVTIPLPSGGGADLSPVGAESRKSRRVTILAE